MFDGVHLGHRAVLKAAVASARRTDGVAAALTFDHHPSRLLNPNGAVPLIHPVDVKVDRMLKAGLDVVITHTFTREFSAVEADQFLSHLKSALPQLASVYVGENWRFGKGRRGDIGLLNELGRAQGIQIFSAPRVKLDGEPISSTRIRAALKDGDIEQVNALLGYTYRSRGLVVEGRRLGRTLGFPTLNLAWVPECGPKHGVYAVKAGLFGNEPAWEGVANYGVRPTVETGAPAEPQLEVHLFEEPPFTTGADLVVDWCAYLRSEKRFTSIEELRDQITMDRGCARQWFDG
ncbi:MAG: bifunctional riboflavin kinase/FAD synthetase [Synoicihabitans sp.]